MENRKRALGFINRNPYDLSQPALSLGKRGVNRKPQSRPDVQGSSYNVVEVLRRDVIRRIKRR